MFLLYAIHIRAVYAQEFGLVIFHVRQRHPFKFSCLCHLKVKEVQFINTMETGNLRHDVMVRCQKWNERMQSKADERAKKSEEKAAKGVAAEERRKLAENVCRFQHFLILKVKNCFI